jgi:hypothetical protein
MGGGPGPPCGEQDTQLTANRGDNSLLMEQVEDGKKGQTRVRRDEEHSWASASRKLTPASAFWHSEF